MYISRFKSWWIAWKDYAAPCVLHIFVIAGEQYRRNEGRTPRHRVKGECQLNFVATIKKKSQLKRSRRWIVKAFTRSMKYIVIEFFNARLFDRYISYKRDVIFAIEIIVLLEENAWPATWNEARMRNGRQCLRYYIVLR